MNEELAFLNVLRANPEDDTTRLVYADWLDEHGDSERAAYLRLLVELAGCEEPGDSEEWSAQLERLWALRETFAADWLEVVHRSGFARLLDTDAAEDEDQEEYTPPAPAYTPPAPAPPPPPPTYSPPPPPYTPPATVSWGEMLSDLDKHQEPSMRRAAEVLRRMYGN